MGWWLWASIIQALVNCRAPEHGQCVGKRTGLRSPQELWPNGTFGNHQTFVGLRPDHWTFDARMPSDPTLSSRRIPGRMWRPPREKPPANVYRLVAFVTYDIHFGMIVWWENILTNVFEISSNYGSIQTWWIYSIFVQFSWNIDGVLRRQKKRAQCETTPFEQQSKPHHRYRINNKRDAIFDIIIEWRINIDIGNPPFVDHKPTAGAHLSPSTSPRVQSQTAGEQTVQPQKRCVSQRALWQCS